jgi:hypothetical protein
VPAWHSGSAAVCKPTASRNPSSEIGRKLPNSLSNSCADPFQSAQFRHISHLGDRIFGRYGQRRAGLAQLVEREFCKLDAAGSIPAAGTTAFSIIIRDRKLLHCARPIIPAFTRENQFAIE